MKQEKKSTPAGQRDPKPQGQLLAEQRETKTWNSNLALIRLMAFSFVIIVHFFIGSAFYDEPVSGMAGFVLLAVRNTAMTCVPLFIVISGYLLNHRTACKNHYLGILRVVTIYLVTCIPCLLYKHFALGEVFGLQEIFGSLTNYYANDYSDYVSMYVVLYFFVPFLNSAWNGLNTLREKRLLLLTLFCVSILPSVVNARIHLYSFWFTNLYPFAYYYLGVYLAEYGVQKKTGELLRAFSLAIMLFAVVNYALTAGKPYSWPGYTSYEGVETFILTALLFAMVLQIHLPSISDRAKRLVVRLANATFSAYLISWLVDEAVYRSLRELVPAVSGRYVYILLTVPICLCVSLALGCVIDALCAPVIRRITGMLSAS